MPLAIPACQGMIRTSARKGYRFVGILRGNDEEGAKPLEPRRASLRHEVRFCSAADGPTIAMADVGQGPPVVKAGNWLNHLEYDWESPVWSHLLHWFANRHRWYAMTHVATACRTGRCGRGDARLLVTDLEAVVDFRRT